MSLQVSSGKGGTGRLVGETTWPCLKLAVKSSWLTLGWPFPPFVARMGKKNHLVGL